MRTYQSILLLDAPFSVFETRCLWYELGLLANYHPWQWWGHLFFVPTFFISFVCGVGCSWWGCLCVCLYTRPPFFNIYIARYMAADALCALGIKYSSLTFFACRAIMHHVES